MRWSIYYALIAAVVMLQSTISFARLSSIDYRLATRKDRNCFFSPIGCLFLSSSQELRLRRHKRRHFF
ncbi:hypothetical protein Q1695_007576 [Nippostrongylus brasiliensis]|nr:hypothetical protein Q1695_007576 [Nippostrongylus brasiliensis]